MMKYSSVIQADVDTFWRVWAMARKEVVNLVSTVSGTLVTGLMREKAELSIIATSCDTSQADENGDKTRMPSTYKTVAQKRVPLNLRWSFRFGKLLQKDVHHGPGLWSSVEAADAPEGDARRAKASVRLTSSRRIVATRE